MHARYAGAVPYGGNGGEKSVSPNQRRRSGITEICPVQYYQKRSTDVKETGDI